jgi:hypothetical protein
MVHVHMLVYGEFIPQQILQGLWSKALGQAAIAYVQSIDPARGMTKAIQEALKYTTKGEKCTREEIHRAAAVEVAFRNVKRLSIGGALRSIQAVGDYADHDDARPEDFHATQQLACVGCGCIGEWGWVGTVAAEVVTRNGGYGLFVLGLETPGLV